MGTANKRNNNGKHADRNARAPKKAIKLPTHMHAIPSTNRASRFVGWNCRMLNRATITKIIPKTRTLPPATGSKEMSQKTAFLFT